MNEEYRERRRTLTGLGERQRKITAPVCKLAIAVGYNKPPQDLVAFNSHNVLFLTISWVGWAQQGGFSALPGDAWGRSCSCVQLRCPLIHLAVGATSRGAWILLHVASLPPVSCQLPYSMAAGCQESEGGNCQLS